MDGTPKRCQFKTDRNLVESKFLLFIKNPIHTYIYECCKINLNKGRHQNEKVQIYF